MQQSDFSAKVLIFIFIFLFATGLFSQNNEWWNTPYPQKFKPLKMNTNMPFIKVTGNSFTDSNGNKIIFKGVNISDPDKLVKNGHWDQKLFRVIKSWGANVVRIPIHPVAWRERGKTEYLKLLDQAVDWASELELYLIIDWHTIGNLRTEMYQHVIYQTSKTETYNFWRTIAFRYQNIPTVAFYEIFNEPTRFNGQLGEITWDEWKTINEEIIRIIFAHDKNVVPLVAGFNWAYDLTPVKENPIEIQGIGYVSHPYPQKTTPPFEKNWEHDFGFVADTYPVIATEIGFMAQTDPGAHIPVIADKKYGAMIISYFIKKGISWTAWCFDPDWPPQLISDWEYTPTEQGAFFRMVMQNSK
jgi:endoglucanase